VKGGKASMVWVPELPKGEKVETMYTDYSFEGFLHEREKKVK
jgi:hypothetical protein